MPHLTWDQFAGWQAYHAAEPWGETRADARAQAVVMWTKAPIQFSSDDLPELTHPYGGQSVIDVMAQKAVLDKRKEEIIEKRKTQRRLAGGGP